MSYKELIYKQLEESRYDQNIGPLKTRVYEASSATQLNDVAKVCNACFKSCEPNESFVVDRFVKDRFVDFCINCTNECKALSINLSKPSETDNDSMNRLAEKHFRRDVAAKLPSAQKLRMWCSTQREYCDCCLVPVTIGNVFDSAIGNRVVVCDACVEQVKKEAVNDFSDMKDFPTERIVEKNTKVLNDWSN